MHARLRGTVSGLPKIGDLHSKLFSRGKGKRSDKLVGNGFARREGHASLRCLEPGRGDVVGMRADRAVADVETALLAERGIARDDRFPDAEARRAIADDLVRVWQRLGKLGAQMSEQRPERLRSRRDIGVVIGESGYASLSEVACRPASEDGIGSRHRSCERRCGAGAPVGISPADMSGRRHARTQKARTPADPRLSKRPAAPHQPTASSRSAGVPDRILS